MFFSDFNNPISHCTSSFRYYNTTKMFTSQRFYC
nr:MAG TPA: hypothetical protein [Caudoviricetes sp.]